MRRYLHVAFILIAGSVHLASQENTFSFEVDGEQRSFMVSLPPSSPPSGGYPLVIVLHGTSGDGERFYNISRWKELGQVENFVSVFPSSLRWCVQDEEDPQPHMTTKWVCGDLLQKACAGQQLKDDVAFLERLVDSVKARIPINASMVFLTGFSNGACMAGKMVLDVPGLFKAVAPTGAGLHELDSLVPEQPTPTWNCVGTKDDRFYVPMGLTEIPFSDTGLAYCNKMVQRHLAVNRLSPQFRKDSNAMMISWTFTTPLPGAPPAFYRFSLIKDLEHNYANGNNHPLVYAQMFWEFFKNVAAATSVSNANHVSLTPVLHVYPNPATSIVTVETQSAIEHQLTVRLVDVLGHTITTAEMENGRATFNTALLPRGAYGLVVGQSMKCLIVE